MITPNNLIETKEFETIIENINSYEVKYNNLRPYKILYIFSLLFKNFRNRLLFFFYLLSELINTATSYINIILFSSILGGSSTETGTISINTQIVYLFIINNLINDWSEQCSNSLIKYMSFATAIECETHIVEKLNDLDIDILDKIQKMKLLQYTNHFIPNFIESFPIYIKLFFLLIILFLGNVYLGYNAFYNPMIVLNVGFIIILLVVFMKYISVLPFLNILTELFQNKFQINDEMFSNLEYLKSSNILVKEYQNERILDNNRVIIHNNTKFILLNSCWGFLQSMIMSAIIVSIFSFNFDNVYLFLYCINNFLTPLESNIIGFLNSFYNISYICGLYDFFKLENRREKHIHIETLVKVDGDHDIECDILYSPTLIRNVSSIEFRHVSKKYIDKTVLEDVSFRIEKGRKIGIVGESGSGKTTIARLIMKLIYSSSGDIFLNEIPLNELPVDIVRDNIVYIGQDPKLFNLSLKYNLTMEMNDEKRKHAITNEELLDYLCKINLQNQEERLEQSIGLSGSKYSGGQKQKINILRGLLKNASCIILDEPTSALDVNSEHQVMDYIHSIYGKDPNKMMIIIAHKLNTIKNVDHILVMDEGTVVEQGSHEELLERGKVYSEMVEKFYSK
jgi:ABC-type multidrug transport system fused ATPase/permease subunit